MINKYELPIKFKTKKDFETAKITIGKKRIVNF